MSDAEAHMSECPPFSKPLVLRRMIEITNQESRLQPNLEMFYDYEQ